MFFNKYNKIFNFEIWKSFHIFVNNFKINTMGWGISAKVEVYLSRITKDELESKIEENESLISMYEKEIIMLAASNPREVAADDSIKEGTIVEDLRIKLDQIFEEYRECLHNQVKFALVSENIDKVEIDE